MTSLDEIIQQSAIDAIWIPFAERQLEDETNLRWIACKFIARIEVASERPTWLTIDHLLSRLDHHQTLEEEYDERSSIFAIA